MKEDNMKRPQRIYWWTLIAWLVGVLIHLVWYVLQMRDQPPTDEVYTRLLSFQAVAFALTTLPYWLGALLLVLILEFAIFGRAKGRDSQ
jgi:hypothetical protein